MTPKTPDNLDENFQKNKKSPKTSEMDSATLEKYQKSKSDLKNSSGTKMNTKNDKKDRNPDLAKKHTKLDTGRRRLHKFSQSTMG